MGFLCQLHIHHTNVSKKHQGHISIIFLTYVLSPHHLTACLDSIFINTTYIIFNLSPHPFPLHFSFCFLFHLITEFELKLHKVGLNILVIYSLGSIHFHFCSKHITPCFTALCNCVIRPCNMLEFSHISSLSTIITPVTKSNQVSTKYSPDVFSNFYRSATHGEFHGIFTTSPLLSPEMSLIHISL